MFLVSVLYLASYHEDIYEKEIPDILLTQKFIIIFTRAHHWSTSTTRITNLPTYSIGLISS
jgi:hypothetical protein